MSRCSRASLFGLLPAIRLSRTNIEEALKAGARSGTLGLGARPDSGACSWSSEMALATVALIGAGLFVRSMQAAQNIDLGFDAAHVGIRRPRSRARSDTTEARGQQFYPTRSRGARRCRVSRRRRSRPSCRRRAAAGVLLTVFPEGQSQETDAIAARSMMFNDVSPGYFDDAAHPDPAAGGTSPTFDRRPTTQVAIINEAAARQLWPGQDALRKRFTIVQQPELYEVVGVAATRSWARSARTRRR